MNTPYYGDSLDILRCYLADESINFGLPRFKAAQNNAARERSKR